MVKVKTESDLIPLWSADFTPGPKNGHFAFPLDPEFERVKDAMDEAMAPLWTEAVDLATVRHTFRVPPPDPPGCPVEGKDVLTELRNIPLRDGAEIELKVYRSAKPSVREGKKKALVMRYHAGGWTVGGHAVEDPENRMIAALGTCVVVSVDYRLAPEFKFPYAHNDSWDALKWVKANPEALGIDPEKIILIGDSAGSNIATTLCRWARDEGLTGILGQVLTFPVTCHPSFFPRDQYELKSYEQNHDASILALPIMEYFLDNYVPNREMHVDHSPLLAKSLEGLAPALLQVAGNDPLRDEGIAYAERLLREGVPTELHVHAGLPHCFYTLGHLSKTREFHAQNLDFISRIVAAAEGAAA